MIETLAYKFKPAGHNAPEKKRDYTGAVPNRKLTEAFEKWLEDVPRVVYYYNSNERVEQFYNSTADLVKGLNPLLDEAHSLLIRYRDHPRIKNAGLFVSAVYNSLPEQEIVFDLELETPPWDLGYKLPKGKTLINLGKTGNRMGWYASGPVVNLGEASDLMGQRASGPVVNLGEAGNRMGVYASGLVIALRGPKGYGNLEQAKLVLKPDDCKNVPELANYLGNLKDKFERGKEDYKLTLAALGELGPKPGKRIEADIKNILKKAGHDVGV